MDNKPVIKVSVGTIIDFAYQGGDLSSSLCSGSRLVEGIKTHQTVQSSRGEAYLSEVPVSYTVSGSLFDLSINGRIDGLYEDNDITIIEEIKSTLTDLDCIHMDSKRIHWAQAKMYAFIYAQQNGKQHMEIRLTYCHSDTKSEKIFTEVYSIQALEDFFHLTVTEYIAWLEWKEQWCRQRNASIKALNFPFTSYRHGQREMAAASYRTIRDNKKLFVQAPTGIGKTMASIFPAVKAMEEGHTSRIFYLTAKTITRTIAVQALDKLREQGLRLRSVTITAKEKICSGDGSCDPNYCANARGYFDRVKDCLKVMLPEENMTRPVIEAYALKYSLCPFELSLDAAINADFIICDYNYAFDPRVYLKRFFQDRKGDHTFLIDEAHNLVDRAREMYSAEFNKSEIQKLKKAIGKQVPLLTKSLRKMNSYMVSIGKICQESANGCHVQKEQPYELYPLLEEFTTICQDVIHTPALSFKEALLTLFFNAMSFLDTAKNYDRRYVTYYEKSYSEIKIKLFCLDPSHLLKTALKRSRSTVFFSATLTPMDYFITLLGGDSDCPSLILPSPFPRDNLGLIINDRISTKFKYRTLTYQNITECIHHVVSSKNGNYMVFFPSYKYMNEIYERFYLQHPDIRVIIQTGDMDEAARERFLEEFEEPTECPVLAFSVLGGIFGEGIDLTGDRLSGAIIIGVGLPQVCMEREIIRAYFDEVTEAGYEYAYVYPGMNKVLQAAGRVIRTESDQGVVVLIDDRYTSRLYQSLYPFEWHPAPIIYKPEKIFHYLHKFWSNKKIPDHETI